MSNLGIKFKRKVSTEQYKYKELEFGFDIPLGILDKTLIPEKVAEVINKKVEPDPKKRKKLEAKKYGDDSSADDKLHLTALAGIAASIVFAALKKS